VNVLAIDFPPISHVLEWPILFGGDTFGVNKVVLLMWLSVLIAFGVLFAASRKRALVPTGVQNIGEMVVDFMRDGIIMQTIGEDGMVFAPFLMTIFTLVLVGNIWEIIPVAQMPVNSRIALPMFIAVLVWVTYLGVDMVKQGPLKYFKNACIPPGVPKAILPLVAFIELITILITRPLSLAVRLFANMLAGHLLLTTFAILTATVWAAGISLVIFPFSLFLLIALTGFEVLVAFLQAFIITILTAVYIGSSLHPEH
jgi:F-type H+-transporting ATPase subunit a